MKYPEAVTTFTTAAKSARFVATKVEEVLQKVRSEDGFTSEIEKVVIDRYVSEARTKKIIGRKMVLFIRPYEVHIPSWQRELDISTVRAIASNFDQNRYEMIKVFYKNGKLYCFEGMHRNIAALLANIPYIEAEFADVSEEEAIKIFLNQAKIRRHMSPSDKYHAQIHPEICDRNAIKLKEVCHNFNIQVKGDDALPDPIGTFTSLRDGYNTSREMITLIFDTIIKLGWYGENCPSTTFNSKLFRVLKQIYANSGDKANLVQNIIVKNCKGASWYLSNIHKMPQARAFDALHEVIEREIIGSVQTFLLDGDFNPIHEAAAVTA